MGTSVLPTRRSIATVISCHYGFPHPRDSWPISSPFSFPTHSAHMFVARMRRLAPLLFLFPFTQVSARDDSLCESVVFRYAPGTSLNDPFSSSHLLCHLLFRTRCSPYPTIRCCLLPEEFFHLVQHFCGQCGESCY